MYIGGGGIISSQPFILFSPLLFVIMPLSIFELKMIYAGNTPNAFCRIPTTELFTLNNVNLEDIKHSHSLFPK